MKGLCEKCKWCKKSKGKFICFDYHYEEDISISIHELKECYTEAFDDYVERMKSNEKNLNNVYLKDLKIDGRKNIILWDLNNKYIEIAFSRAKKIFDNIELIRKLDDLEYKINSNLLDYINKFNFEYIKRCYL